MDYKATLNLPQTDFPMKASLSQREPEILALWEKERVYHRLLEVRRGGPAYILHDGPPYANGHIHIGHALNKILKDFVVRSKAMEGHRTPYVPGWDCHGLPIEHQVEKELGKQREAIAKDEVRRRCRAYALKFVEIQREEFKRLGVMGDWERPYLTMSYDYEATIIREFGKLVAAGSVYKGKKPVHWCPTCVTALAEAEVEYADHESPSIYVAFPVLRAAGTPLADLPDAAIAIWTTTPWTLPANLAVAAHPEAEYVAVRRDGATLVVAVPLLAALREKLGLGEEVARFRGRDLEGVVCRHPWIDREAPVIFGEHVTMDQGTGFVHTAPGHGQEDYQMGLQYGLAIYAPVDAKGRFTSDVALFAGQPVFKANPAIVSHLKTTGRLLLEERMVHAYPHCWRCKRPILFRATEQWFIAMAANRLQERAIAGIHEVQWVPPWGKDRILGMMEHRPDWCISRQRAWGVPIPVFLCASCREPLLDPRLVDRVAELVEQGGADIWFDRPVADLLPAGTACPRCGGKEFEKEHDILDVWFDSGVSHAAVLERTEGLRWPADLYLEGSDQHRGWFQSALLTAVATRGRAPYASVLTHGFVVDGRGKKMSKSAGNVVAPQEVIARHGAEILRLWVAAENYREDVRISEAILVQLVEAYRRIRNTCRYLLGNLSDFDRERHPAGREELWEIDRWALLQLQRLIQRVRKAYADYEFHLAFHAIHQFCIVELSAFYLDVLKDRLYTFAKDSPARRAGQQTLAMILDVLVRLMAPVLAFTAEEVWRALPQGVRPREAGGSVHLARFPDVEEAWLDPELEQRWERLLLIRGEIAKALERARMAKQIGASQEAEVRVYAGPETCGFLAPYREELAMICIVSSAVLAPWEAAPEGAFRSEVVQGLAVEVAPAPGAKCARCWNWSRSVGTDAQHPALCDRCLPIVQGVSA